MKTLLITGILIMVLVGIKDLQAEVNPYLQTPTPTSIYISWHSTDSSFTKVHYGLSATGLNQVQAGSFQNISGKIWHTVKLTSLTPDTRYYYRCISGADSSNVYPFRSEPLQGIPGQHIRFVIFGDSRYDDTIPTNFADVCQAVQQTLEAKYGSAWYDSVNIVMHTGDIVYSGLTISRFQTEYFTPISNLSCSIPFMVSIGNHEHESVIYFSYMKYEDFTDSLVATTAYNERFYSFDIAGCRFVILNSNDRIIGAPLQAEWLNKVLTNADTAQAIDFVFPFAHHPYHTEVWTEGNNDSVKVVFFPRFLDHYKVVQYSYGHAHDFEKGVIVDTNSQNFVPHDLHILLTGGGGAGLTRFFHGSHDYPEIQKTVDDYNYTLIDVNVDNKSYTAEVYTLGKPEHPINNQLLDVWHFSMLQPPPDKPVVYPVNTANPVILSASPMVGGDSCMSSRFQITKTQGNYTTLVLDTIRDYEDVFENTGVPDFIPINKNAGIDLTKLEVHDSILILGTHYWYRARYRDYNLKWSPWSDEVGFLYTGITDLNFSSKDFNLSQNFPNPFNTSTIVGYELTACSFVTIKVYDPMGVEIATLVNEEKQAGYYTVEFPVSGLRYPAEIYYVQMKCNDFIQARKMVITK
ncbi:MAG: fibronectin type III domain-containing protein [Bacteroidetes bacterium]|nr:fibronectin type III domain-containing protein [Bacteroidota bacterium]